MQDMAILKVINLYNAIILLNQSANKKHIKQKNKYQGFLDPIIYNAKFFGYAKVNLFDLFENFLIFLLHEGSPLN